MPLPARRRPARGAWPAAAVLATLVAGVWVERRLNPGDVAAAAGDLAVGVAFIAAGAAAWAHGRSAGLAGPLMVATGVTWFAGGVAGELALLHRGPLVQLLVTAPDGRPREPAEWAVVVAGYASALIPAVGRADGATAALGVLVAGVALDRWARAAAAERRARALPAAAATAVGLALIAAAFAEPADAGAVLWVYEAVLVATAAALGVALRSGPWTRSVATSVVIDLGDLRAGTLSAALAHAVGDPSLQVGYGTGEGRYVDDQGQRLPLPAPGARRAVTTVEVDGEPAAVILHDPAALRARGVADAVRAGVRLALHNRRLQGDIRARVLELEASRARLLRARDDERRRLEARLHAGVERRLDAAASALAELGEDGDASAAALPDHLERTRVELRRFAAGLHPPDLEPGGLATALARLADGAPIAVDVRVDRGRLAERLELAAWFVCSEGLANVAKHARATRAAIAVERVGGELLVTVDDDGDGGADPAGRGLLGLAARVEAAGGGLVVAHAPAGGTRLLAHMPAEESP